ncbi:MAG: RnfABCDGE type electron transport complex subunit G [Spirochaetaceae bacterium]|jgi:electron transport complex protein RnfG|nr:RnfABCDGE type electron transport complex subunit G [Spirochaetaceae bacterium]
MKTWDILKLGLVLMVYAAVACVGLAFVYAGTEKTIEQRERADQEAALKELFPHAERFEEIPGTIVSPDNTVSFESQWEARQGSTIIGVALQAVGGSYGGSIEILVGVNADGTISRIKIMSHSDTPGLGANAAKKGYFVNKEKRITFYDQFDGKPVSDPFEPKNDVIAITAATITSRAVSTAVKVAGTAAEQWLAEQGAGI